MAETTGFVPPSGRNMAETGRIDLNADLGEGFGPWRLGDDRALLDVVTSANVACGFHAGDAKTMARVCGWAAEGGVAVGAHVSWRDLEGFGRRNIDIAPADVADEVVYQIGALAALAEREGTQVGYIKPHGALYNRCFSDEEMATAVAEAVHAADPDLMVLGQPGSALLSAAASRRLGIAREAFADRAYQISGKLVPRSVAGSVLSRGQAVAQAIGIASHGAVETDGGPLALTADSICVHGDTPDALALAADIRAALESAGLVVAAFVPTRSETAT
jgi:UPF0271 protein